jgi:hypothetical protein
MVSDAFYIGIAYAIATGPQHRDGGWTGSLGVNLQPERFQLQPEPLIIRPTDRQRPTSLRAQFRQRSQGAMTRTSLLTRKDSNTDTERPAFPTGVAPSSFYHEAALQNPAWRKREKRIPWSP